MDIKWSHTTPGDQARPLLGAVTASGNLVLYELQQQHGGDNDDNNEDADHEAEGVESSVQAGALSEVTSASVADDQLALSLEWSDRCVETDKGASGAR